MKEQLSILTLFVRAWTTSDDVIHTNEDDAKRHASATNTTLTAWARNKKSEWEQVPDKTAKTEAKQPE